MYDAGPALKSLRRLEPAAPCLRHVKSLFEHLLNGVQRRAYSPLVLHLARVMAKEILARVMATEILTGVMATHVMGEAILRLGESRPQYS